MKAEVKRVLDQTMTMPPKDRAAIAERILASLDDTVEEEVEEAWQAEVQHRLAEIARSKVECIPWEEVRDSLRKT